MTNDEQSNEFVILRQEARYRLKEGSGIKIFAKPQELADWMEKNDVDVAQREHLFVDAGTIVNTFSLDNDGIEFLTGLHAGPAEVTLVQVNDGLLVDNVDCIRWAGLCAQTAPRAFVVNNLNGDH